MYIEYLQAQQWLSFNIQSITPRGMEKMEVVLLRHFVMDQMYALLVL